mgnify:CR=1
MVVNSRSEYLNNIKLDPNPIIIELGVFRGDFSKMLLDKYNPSEMYLVDPWVVGSDISTSREYSFGKTAYSTSSDLNIVQNRFDKYDNVNIIKKYSYEAIPTFTDGYFDMVYIDACHLYECVIRDIEISVPKIKKNGYLCGHDYINIKEFGVIQAVDEFLQKSNRSLHVLNLDGGDWAIKI